MHIFCFALQFKTWYELFKADKEGFVNSSKEVDMLMSEDSPTGKTTRFAVEMKASHYVRAHVIYQRLF